MTEIQWNRRPDPKGYTTKYTLRRCPTRGRLHVVILSHDMQCAPTHYFAGRTRPCSGTACQACARNHMPRWHGWIAAIDLDTNEHVVVELSRAVCDKVTAIFDERRTLRGMRMILERKNPKPNAAIHARFAPPAAGTGELEEAPDVRPILARIWEIKDDAAIPRAAPANLPPLKTGTYDTGNNDGGNRELD